jgi:hypothetical protein
MISSPQPEQVLWCLYALHMVRFWSIEFEKGTGYDGFGLNCSGCEMKSKSFR